MSLHPAAPEDLPALTAAYVQTVQSISDLGHSLRPGDAERETQCPGWTVHDQFAHVVSLEAWVQGEEPPELEDAEGDGPQAQPGINGIVARFLASRRDRSLEELLEELDDLATSRVQHLEAETTSPDDPAVGPFGATTLHGLTENRLFDLWVHEQDIREAIGRPGNLDGAAAAHCVRLLFAALPRIVARTAQVPEGHAVILDLSGPVVGRAGARVEVRDGKAHGIPLFSGDSEHHPDVVTTTITMSTQAATRRATGRVSTDDTHVTVTGDEEIARRVLDAMVIAP
ncbi:maleylpyruvate isomerase family mycothiol-dependent enzyme [Knoellia sp. LjRoot47]|uniref:maleylpyruvate isomerase family mycothiol-dependent enzyme n=1 Tax=Knoellia sp. LjRoot47 TaxID=3342330 RepID=UPI003ECE0EFC